MKLKKVSLLSLLLVLVLVFSSAAYASGLNQGELERSKNSESDVMNLKGPTVIIDLGQYGTGVLKKDKNGDYSGEIKARASTFGVTAVSCVLSGNTGGVSNLYTIYIRWIGTDQVANIRATNLKITSTSWLKPQTFYSNSFSISAGSRPSGFASVGVCVIPTSVKTVRIKTTGLQCYFNSTAAWLSTEINGTVNVN